MVANTSYPEAFGHSVYWEFCRTPSQVMENWCYKKRGAWNCLQIPIYQTGEVIQWNWVQKIKDSGNFPRRRWPHLATNNFGFVGMSWQGDGIRQRLRMLSSESLAFKDTDLLPECLETCDELPHCPIYFKGGYSSGLLQL